MASFLENRATLKRYAWLSISAAIVTITLKCGAYFLTGSVGLLSDAMEGLVNLAAAAMALAMLTIASRPADEEHAYGYSKAEYFSSGAEGTLILIAALGIGVAAIKTLFAPRPLAEVGLGLGISLVASMVNLGVSVSLSKAGKRYQSVTLESDARHLMTDVWTSGGVLIGVAAVGLTGWDRLDPIVALLVAANIVRSGVDIVRRSVLGLMDTALPPREADQLGKVLGTYVETGIQIHALRTRQAGARRFVSMHVIVPGAWTVDAGHRLLEGIEADIRKILPGVTVFTHLESLDDPASWDDVTLDRESEARRMSEGTGT